jgi:hypothetical protein
VDQEGRDLAVLVGLSDRENSPRHVSDAC